LKELDETLEKMKVVVEDRCWAAFGHPQNASKSIGFNVEKDFNT
jgi:hypothetical protein